MDFESRQKAKRLIERLEQLQNIRANWDSRWDYIARRVSPKEACFQSEPVQGQPESAWRKFDSTASLAIQKWASAMDGLTTPKTQKWHNITLSDKDLAERYKPFLEGVRDILFQRRYAASSNFPNANFENLKSVGTFGNGPFSLSPNAEGTGNVYKAWDLREFYVDQNFEGDIDVFFRKFKLSARQAIQEFGELCPDKVKNCKNLQETFDFLWAVYPNTDYKPGSLLATNKKVASVYVCITTGEVISESGFDICPLFYPRYDVTPNLQDPYGYAPILFCLPEVKNLNKMYADMLKVSDRMANPPILMTEDDIIERTSMTNDVIISGGIDANGNPRVAALQLAQQTGLTLEMIQDLRTVINESFNLNLFQILVDKPNMTATEVLQRAQEQGTLLGSFTSRREKEFLSLLIQKETDIAWKQGALPEPPAELLEAIGSGDVHFSVEYESPIVRSQKADEGTAIMRTLEVATALQQFDPSIKNKINSGRILEKVADVWGAPASIFNSEDEQAAKDMEDAQLAQAQQMLAAAPVIGKSAKDMAEAQQIAGISGLEGMLK
ncbi:MAG: head-tail connector protein [Prevotella sp.]|nr:head-tail connector protein [Prevotella sp.]